MAGLRLRCAAALLPIVLLFAFATAAGAAGLKASAAGSWGPGGRLTHRAGATRVRSSRAAPRRSASPSLGASGAIEGKVTDAVTAASVEGIEVCAWPLEVEEEEFLEPECKFSGAKGKYAITGLPAGEYIVEFATPFDSTLNYVAQFYPGEPSFEAATPVKVNAGATAKANASLVHGGRVAGKVTAANGGAPIAGIEVCAWNTAPEVESFGCGETGPGGEYLVTGLAPGSYKVGFRSPPGVDYITQFYSGKSAYNLADEISVSKEVTTGGIDAAMVQGGKITGVVTVAATGKPLPEALVCALSSAGGEITCAETEASGAYTIAGLREGQYHVEFVAGSGFAEEFYDGVFSQEEATAVHVTPGSVTSGIDAAMVQGGEISGVVTAAATGKPISGALVCALSTGEGETICAKTEPNGAYTIAGLPGGEYDVRFRDGSGFAEEFYDGVFSLEEATAVHVTPGSATAGIDAAMVQGGEISGVVTAAATGKPLSGALACALDSSEEIVECAESEPTGAYTIAGLPTGEYDVWFVDSAGFEEEFWDGVFSIEEATRVAVTAGSVHSGINAAMYAEAIAPRLEGEHFPTITGTIAVGSTVSCSQGSWSGTAPLTFSYQWVHESLGSSTRVPVPGATATTYTIQSSDIGWYLACEVTASNRAGSFWATSKGYRVPAPVAPVMPPPPAVTPAATTPASAGGVQGAKTVVPSISVLGRLSSVRGNALAKLHCSIGPCKGSLQLTVTVARRHRSGGHTVTRHVTITIGSGGFSLAQGATGRVGIHLTSEGRKLLADAARHPRAAKLKLTMQNAPATSKAVVVG